MLALDSVRHQLQISRLRDFFAGVRRWCVAVSRKVVPQADENESTLEDDEMAYRKTAARVHWWFTPAFLLFWLVLLFAVIMPVFFRLPEGLRVENEQAHLGQFIAERAERILFDFDMIGPKVTGSYANENVTVQLLFDEIEKIRRHMHQDLFDLEVNLQLVSGAYVHWNMVNMYQGLQNVVVRFKAKNATSESYLLINSHFDSKPGSPGSGDDGAMVVIMLEILRVLATTRQTFMHPIIFLFNGAEENPLQASHGFITKHEWAKNCKALINLDSAGSGNREILFQSGPNHPWLMDYYNRFVKRPFATTFAEEIFQANLIPSDTDFRIFRDYGHLPGLDFAHSYNGYVYHTKFDRYSIIPRGTLQATGDNILALARAFADSPELEDPTPYADGHTVFYDFLGVVFIYYTETTGKILNTCIAIAAIVLVVISFWRMAATSYISLGRVLRIFALILLLHLVAIALAFGLPIVMAVIYDNTGRPMTWFTHKWLILGLYICPTLFGLSAPTLLYFSFSRNDKLSLPYRLQMVLHAHTVILALICIVITFLGIRSSYFCMIVLFFYALSLLLNLITTLHGRGFFWTIFVMLSQVLPFLYFTYLFHAFLCTIMPMMGRFGTATNPDLFIAGLTALGIVLSMGYLIPLLNMFRYPKLALLSLLIITFIFAMLSLSPLGFPYRAKTNVGRVNLMEVRRVFYEYNGSVSRNESGYYFDFQDRRKQHSIEESVDLEDLQNVAEDCDLYLMCGLPVFNHRLAKNRREAMWLPRDEPVFLAATPNLTLQHKTVNATTNSVRFDFVLSGPPHMSIFIQPLDGVSVSTWSFLKNMLEDRFEWQPPYHIYFTYGKDNTPLQFFIELEKANGRYDVALMELGIGAHYVSFEHVRDAETHAFLRSFPQYIYVMEWPSSFERYIF